MAAVRAAEAPPPGVGCLAEREVRICSRGRDLRVLDVAEDVMVGVEGWYLL